MELSILGKLEDLQEAILLVYEKMKNWDGAEEWEGKEEYGEIIGG